MSHSISRPTAVSNRTRRLRRAAAAWFAPATCAPQALSWAPPYNLARLGFEWSAVVARAHLVGSGRNTAASAWLRPQPPAGGTTGTDGGAHGPIDAARRQGAACLLREHEAQSTVLGRDLRPDRPDHAQS